MSVEKPDIDALCASAAAIDSPEERAAFIARACGDDDELRRKVERLLASGAKAANPQATLATDSAGGNLAASLDAGLTSAFYSNEAVVVGSAGHSVLASLEKTVNVPRVKLQPSGESGATNPAESTELPKSIPAGRYQLQGEIARGGMGAIIKGRDNDLGRDLAIKVLLDAHKEKPEVIERFVEEAQIGGQLQHPGIVPVYELGQFADQRPFFSMKLVKGKTLSQLLASRSDPAEDRARFIGMFEQICQTLAYAHSRGVIHRDLKPANIMVGAFGEVQVMDWGLAKVLSSDRSPLKRSAAIRLQESEVIQTRRGAGSDVPGSAGSAGSQTQVGSVMGTPAYMPPEQAQGKIDLLDRRADVFGLGAILCEILTGLPPYVGENGTDVFLLASRGELKDTFSRLDGCGADPDLINLAKECLSTEAADRPADAGVLSARITGYLESVEQKLRATELARVDAQVRAEELRRRQRLALTAGTSIVTILLVGIGLSLWLTFRATSAESRERLAKENAIELATANGELAEKEAGLRKEAVTERERADQQRLIAETAKYAVQLKLATADYEGFDVGSALAILNSTNPNVRGWEYDHLLAQCNGRLRNFDNEVPHSCVAITGDGKFVAAGTRTSVRIWEFGTGRLYGELNAGGEAVSDVKFSPDGKRLAAVTASSVYLWDVAEGKQVGTTKLNATSSYRRLAFDSQGERIAVAHGGIQIWDAQLSKELIALKPELDESEQGGYAALAFAPEANQLAARLEVSPPPENRGAGYSEEYLLFDLDNGEMAASSGRERSSNNTSDGGLGFDPTGKWFFSAGGAMLQIRDASTAKVDRVTQIPMCKSVAMSGDGSRLAVITAVDMRIDIYSLPDIALERSLPFGTLLNFPQALAMSSDGTRIVAAAGERNSGSVDGWDLDGDGAITTLVETYPGAASRVTSSVPAGWVAVAIGETEKIDREALLNQRPLVRPKQFGYVQFHSLESGEELFSLPKMEGRIMFLESSRDGQRIITTGVEPNMPVLVWDMEGRNIERELVPDVPAEHRSVITNIATDAMAKLVCATFQVHDLHESGRLNSQPIDLRAVVWETATGKVVWETKWSKEWLLGIFPSRNANSVIIDPTGERVVVVRCKFKEADRKQQTGIVAVDAITSINVVRIKDDHSLGELEEGGAISPVFSQSSENTIYLYGEGIEAWDYRTGGRTQISKDFCQKVIVAPDDHRLVALEQGLSNPGTISLFDPATRQEVFRVPNNRLRYVALGIHLTDDGRNLIIIDKAKVLLLRGE